MTSFVSHPTSVVEPGSQLGEGSELRAYSVVGAGVVTGRQCIIAEHAVLNGPVRLGENVTIEAGTIIAGDCQVGNDVRIGPHACIQAPPGQTIEIRDGAVIGAQATIGAAVVIDAHTVVCPGAVITKNVPATAVVSGHPAKIVGYVAAASAAPVAIPEGDTAAVIETRVRGVRLHNLPLVEDLRGNLSFGEALRHVPFEVKRYFLTFDVDTEEVRGEHAHRRLEQFLVCVHGRLHIMADDGTTRQEFVLDRPNLAVYLPPLVWGVQYRFSAGAVLMVLCSDYYEPGDYIREYSDFLALARSR